MVTFCLLCKKQTEASEGCRESNSAVEVEGNEIRVFENPQVSYPQHYPSIDDEVILQVGESSNQLMMNARRFYGKFAMTSTGVYDEKPDQDRIERYVHKITVKEVLNHIGIIRRPEDSFSHLEGTFYMEGLWNLQNRKWVPIVDNIQSCQRASILHLNGDDRYDAITLHGNMSRISFDVYLANRDGNIERKQSIAAWGRVSYDFSKPCRAWLLAENKDPKKRAKKVAFNCAENRFVMH